MCSVNYKFFSLILLFSLFLASCALVSSGATSSSAIKQLGYAKTAAEFVSLSYTDKSITDHAISIVTKKDCKMTRIVKRQEICMDNGPKVIEHNQDSEDMKLTNQMIHVATHNPENTIGSLPKKLNKEIINLNKEEVISLKNVDALTVNIDDDYNLPHNLYSLNENISKPKQIYSSNVDVLSHTLISNNLDFSANENTLVRLDNNLCFSI
ncbi:MAG: hypothetical protein CFH23_00475 [Alphaproteobacteria bacterium MarineAlpha6_Bin1]|nr:MAG: hypothetical protein CFH23_00475 [Alphaproteobacteria bacterium MarineAlpha6_Bin1]